MRSWLRVLGTIGLVFWGSSLPVSAGTDPTFNREVARIVWERCAACHRPGGAGPFSLIDYGDVAKRAELIADVIKSRYMPPWPPTPGIAKFEGERWMPDGEIETVIKWVEGDRPQVHPEDLPPKPTWPSGWSLGEPYLILEMDEAFTTSAEGPDVFRSFVLPIHIQQARYVRGFEFRSGDARIAHHARVLLDSQGVARLRDAFRPDLCPSPPSRYPRPLRSARTPA